MALLRPPALFQVASDVHGFRTGIANVFFVGQRGGSEWVLIDAGMPGWGPSILRVVSRLFGGSSPRAIILTHGHFDHVGALHHLSQLWQAPVFAPALELPHVNDRVKYPPPDPTVGGGFMALSSFLYPRHMGPPATPARPLPSDGTMPFLPGWRVIPTPGHTEGHVSFYRSTDRVLIAGDALISTKQESFWAVFRQALELRSPPAYFTTDWRDSYESICRIRELNPNLLASGHGLPLGGEALRDGLDNLVRHFSDIGLPRHGRYLNTWYKRPPAQRRGIST